MNEVSFRDKIIALRNEYLSNTSNTNRTHDFWYVMDSISDELVMKWAERVSRIKTPIHGHYNSGEWFQLCDILHYMKTYDKYNELPWTVAQKRFCTLMIVKMWDDLEMDYYC